MLKSYQSIILFLGVFGVAYAGFMYMEYESNQAPVDARLLSATDDSSPASNSSASPDNTLLRRQRALAGVSGSTRHDSDGDARGRDEQPGHKQSARDDDLDKAEDSDRQQRVAAFQRSREQQLAIASTPRRSTGLTATSASSYSLSTSLGSSGGNRGNISNNSDTAGSASPETVSQVNDNSNSASSLDDADVDSPGSPQNDPASAPLEEESIAMATPNCPYKLQQGTTGEQAQEMLEIYGCRYRQSCIMKNDGTKNYDCHWEYIRSF